MSRVEAFNQDQRMKSAFVNWINEHKSEIIVDEDKITIEYNFFGRTLKCESLELELRMVTEEDIDLMVTSKFIRDAEAEFEAEGLHHFIEYMDFETFAEDKLESISLSEKREMMGLTTCWYSEKDEVFVEIKKKD